MVKCQSLYHNNRHVRIQSAAINFQKKKSLVGLKSSDTSVLRNRLLIVVLQKQIGMDLIFKFNILLSKIILCIPKSYMYRIVQIAIVVVPTIIGRHSVGKVHYATRFSVMPRI